jgi:hypothetical protein
LWSRVTALADHLRAQGHDVDLRTDESIATLVEVTGDRPRHILFYAVEAAYQWLEHKPAALIPSGLDRLRTILKDGPGKHVHTIGWWRGVTRFKETINMSAADDIGAWVALDVQGNDLNSIAAGQVIHWSPRSQRAIFFDKSTHSHPDVIIPFDTSTALEPS